MKRYPYDELVEMLIKESKLLGAYEVQNNVLKTILSNEKFLNQEKKVIEIKNLIINYYEDDGK